MISFNIKTGEATNVPDTIPLPTPAESQAWVDAETSAKAKSELAKIDAQSIRAMREFILSKFASDPLLPTVLAGHESAAGAERKKIRI